MNTQSPLPNGRGILLVVYLGAALSGCSSVNTRTLERGDVSMTEDQFAAQVERVFRYHNTITEELINTQSMLEEKDEDDGGASSTLAAAEEKMDEACELLNEVVSAQSVTGKASFWAKQQLPSAVPECEAATRRVDALLQRLFPTGRKLTLYAQPDTAVEQ